MRTGQPGSSLKIKFIFLVTLLILIILSLLTVTHLVRERKAVILSLTGKARTLSGVIQRIAQNTALEEQYFPKISDTILMDEDLQVIALFRADGTLKFTSGKLTPEEPTPTLVAQALDLACDRTAGPTIVAGQDTFDYLSTIPGIAPETPDHGPGRHEVLWLRLRLDNVNQAIKRIIRENLRVSVIAILFSVLMAIFLAQVIINPISLLAEGIRRIIQGNYDAPITVARDDEIGELGRSFNEMVRKIAENRDIEKLLFEQEKLATIGQLAASMAHEVRNPLATVRALNQLVADDLTPDSPQVSHLNLALDEIDRVNAVLEQFLAYARPRESSFIMAEVAPIIERVIRLTGPMAQKKGISLNHTVQPGLAGWLDPEQVAQALVNLIMNSLNACPKGAAIQINVTGLCENILERATDFRGKRTNLEIVLERQQPDTLLIEVSDNGPGVPQELREKIFEPFVSSTPNGTGLGLAICKKIALSHQGGITLLEPQGGGAAFHLKLSMTAPGKSRI